MTLVTACSQEAADGQSATRTRLFSFQLHAAQLAVGGD